MSAPASVRQRGGQKNKRATSTPPLDQNGQARQVNDFVKPTEEKSQASSQWDYKGGLAIVTILAFVTRFWGIGHPKEVVFDEVHFGKVSPRLWRQRALEPTPLGYVKLLMVVVSSLLHTTCKEHISSMSILRLESSSLP